MAKDDKFGLDPGLRRLLSGVRRLDFDFGTPRDDGITRGREEHFNRQSGRFHDPGTGEFEDGGPPPDLDAEVDRFRAADGKFKSRSADLFDEPAEVELDSLEPRG